MIPHNTTYLNNKNYLYLYNYSIAYKQCYNYYLLVCEDIFSRIPIAIKLNTRDDPP